jgi:hypothetical protein
VTGRRRPLLVGLVVGILLGSAGVAHAAFTASRVATQSVSTRSLTAPTGLTATQSGHNVTLSWTAGSGGSGYTVYAVNNGTSDSCAAATFTALTTTASTSLTDTGRYTPQGTYECYKVATTYGSWSSQASNPFDSAQLGVVAARVVLANGATAGKLDAGDTIVVTFNQAITTSTGPSGSDNVCTTAGGTIALGSTGSGGSCSLTGLNLGTLTGLSVGASSRFAATWTWSGANTVLTVTIGTRTAGSTTSVSGTATFDPTSSSTKLTSATGGFHTCDTNSGGGSCLPTASGSF